MNFEELGQALKQERERKGLSIEVVMEATKISRTNIVAMENGNRSAMPHPVYTKGFVKSYARYLGMDADELSMVVDREFQDDADEAENFGYDVSPQAEKAFQEPAAVESKGRKVWPMLIVLVFLIGVVVLLVMNFTGKSNDEAVEEVVVEEVVEETPPAPEVIAPESEVVEPEATPEEPAVEEVAQPEAPAVEEKPAPPVLVPEKPEPKPEPETPVAVKKPEKSKYDHMLVIRATTDKGCWIGIWKGDEPKMYRDFVLKNGEPLRLNFNTPRRLRIGNASGVSVMYNGKPHKIDGAKGNIQTLRFGY